MNNQHTLSRTIWKYIQVSKYVTELRKTRRYDKKRLEAHYLKELEIMEGAIEFQSTSVEGEFDKLSGILRDITVNMGESYDELKTKLSWGKLRIIEIFDAPNEIEDEKPKKKGKKVVRFKLPKKETKKIH